MNTATESADHAAFARVVGESLSFHHEKAATTIAQCQFSSVDYIHTFIVEMPAYCLFKEQGPKFHST